MNSTHYIGFDIHKKVINFCEKLMDGTIVEQGVIRATRQSLNNWADERTTPWIGAMEATLLDGFMITCFVVIFFQSAIWPRKSIVTCAVFSGNGTCWSEKPQR